jgi:signal transduction histidine kinase
MLLASALLTSKNLESDDRVRAEQLVGEARWLNELMHAYEAAPTGEYGNEVEGSGPIRLDELAADIVRSIELSCTAHISVDAQAVSARVGRLSLWRAVRNVVCNALEAAGPNGTLIVRVSSDDGFVAIDIDDDGPGFDSTQAKPASLGLTIVEEFVASYGGRMEIGRGSLGGCRVRLLLPEVQNIPSGPVPRARCAL